MILHAIRSFCRYLTTQAAFDDRIGLLVWDDDAAGVKMVGLLSRRLRARVMRYTRNTSEPYFLSFLNDQVLSPVSAIVVLESPPGALFTRLIRAQSAAGSRLLSGHMDYGAQPTLVVAVRRELLSSLGARHDLRKIGLVLDLQEKE